MVQNVSAQRFFTLIFLYFIKTTNLCWKYYNHKKKQQELPPPPDPSKIDNYKNFDELCKRVTKLSLKSYWKINCSNTVHLFKTDPIYENPVLDIFVSDTFNFIIRVFARCLHTDHEINKNYNTSVNNITVLDLVKVLSNYRVCEGIKNQQILSYCNQHVAFKKIWPLRE